MNGTILSSDVKPLNSSGKVLPVQRAQRSAIVPVLIPANSTIPIAAAGTQFYVLQTSAAVNIRVSGGAFNTYYAGTGENYVVEQPFSNLEIQNPYSTNISCLIFVGFSDFIDKRLYLTNSQFPQVVYPTAPVPNVAASIAINDRSGTQITDINGNLYWAVKRFAVVISNFDTGTTYILQKAGGTGGITPGLLGVFPQTNVNLPIDGNYSLATGGGNINCIVSEIYQVIPVT